MQHYFALQDSACESMRFMVPRDTPFWSYKISCLTRIVKRYNNVCTVFFFFREGIRAQFFLLGFARHSNCYNLFSGLFQMNTEFAFALIRKTSALQLNGGSIVLDSLSWCLCRLLFFSLFSENNTSTVDLLIQTDLANRAH